MPPDSATASGLDDDIDTGKKSNKAQNSNFTSVPKVSPREQGPLRMKDVYKSSDGDALDNKLVEIVLGGAREVELYESSSVDGSGTSKIGKKVWGSAEEMQLKPENIARVVPGRIMSLRFFPTRDMQMVAVGNKFGEIGFWHVNGKEEDGDGIHLYHVHEGPVSGIAIDPFSISKVRIMCMNTSL